MAEDKTSGAEWRGRIVNFIFGSVLAGLVTTSFTYKTWQEQARLDFAKERLKEANAAYDTTSQLMSARIFRSYDVVRHIGDKDDSFPKRRETLDQAVDNWNLSYPDALQRFQFSLEVDDKGRSRPLREISSGSLDGKLDCTKAFDDQNRPPRADWDSPSWLLAAFHYCVIRTDISRKSGEVAKLPATPARYATIIQMDEKIDQLSTHADHVRVAAKKAIQKRRTGVETHGFLEFLGF